jgi:excinuclease ABC subunit A
MVRNATLHNLKGVSARVPLARLTVVTGVSGSGKSTFARDVLHASLAAAAPVGCAALDGRELIGRLLEVDQTPIGKTPRSCPATYIGFWDAIRKLFAETTEAKMRGWTASRFSFNTGAGRCPVCEGRARSPSR